MTDNMKSTGSPRRRRLAGAAGLLLVGGIAGGAVAATSSASAAVTPSPTASAPAAGAPKAPARTAKSVRPGETAQTGRDLAALKAAALKAVPGGSVYRVETDADGSAYEAHLTKSNGTEVTVKFDKNLKVTAVQDGMGAGGPRDGRGPGGPGGTGGTPPASSGAGA